MALVAALAPAARAQISLPARNPAHAHGHIASFLLCRVCGERNYVSSRDGRRDEEGHEIAWCSHCQRDTAQDPPAQMNGLTGTGREGAGGLSLPPANRAFVRSPTSPVRVDPAPPAATPPVAPNAVAVTPPAAAVDGAQRDAANAIFTDLARVHDIADHKVAIAVDELLALEEAGREASRAALSHRAGAVEFAAGRVLLHSANAADRELVAARVKSKAPGAAGPHLLDLLAESDPVLVSPRFLAELLDSPHSGVRAGAERHLRGALGPELLPILKPLFSSKQSETRLRALALVSAIDDPSVTGLLLERIADPTAKVASAVVSLVAARPDPALDAELLGRAFRTRWILRESAYALLTLCEREDLSLAPVLDDSHVEPLLTGLQSNNPFVAGACATALAGIGFRSPQTKSTAWLDREVVDRLVYSVSGKEYHDDFTALAGTALRRLKLLSGEDFGTEGPRWVTWWLQVRDGFYARRAHIEVDESDASRLVLRVRSAIAPECDFALMAGALAAQGQARPAARDVAYLTDAQAREALVALRREGVFGAERLPGVRGRQGEPARTFELTIAGRGKSFTFCGTTTEPWFERVNDMARALLQENRWQRYPRPQSDALALWREESAWWVLEHTELERAQHLKDLVLRALPARSSNDRVEGIAELERAFAIPGVARLDDFVTLTSLVRTEALPSERTTRLVRLALIAARAGSPSVPADRARALCETLLQTHGKDALNDLIEVAAACDDEFVCAMARDERPIARVAAAEALAQRSSASNETASVLLHLLDDRVTDVEVAAIEACGERRVESARTELLVRARLGSTAPRAAALEAIGRLGGELVLDALAVGIVDPDPRVRVSAARGLATLGGPGSVSLLVTVLGDGGQDEIAEAARAGLEKLGPLAWPELLRVVHAPAHRARRAAALILAAQGAPDAASALMTLLSSDPRDAHVASELAILTCVDLRAQGDPATAWWEWWDGVVHDDSLSWFLAALERPVAGSTGRTNVPSRDAFDGRGTLEAHLALLAAMDRPESYVAERARRELARRLGRDLGKLPARGALRDAWLATVRESLAPTREE